MTHNLVAILVSGTLLITAVLREAVALWSAKRGKSSVIISTRHGQIDITNLDSATASKIVAEALNEQDPYKVRSKEPTVGHYGD